MLLKCMMGIDGYERKAEPKSSSWTLLPGLEKNQLPQTPEKLRERHHWEKRHSSSSISLPGTLSFPRVGPPVVGKKKESKEDIPVVVGKKEGVQEDIFVYANSGREEVAEAIECILNNRTQANSPEAEWIDSQIKISKNKISKKILQALYPKINPQIIEPHTVAKIQLYEEKGTHSNRKDTFNLSHNLLVKMQQTIENMFRDKEKNHTIRVFASNSSDERERLRNQKNREEKLRNRITSDIQKNKDIPQEIYTLDTSVLKMTVAILLYIKRNICFEKNKEIDLPVAIEKIVHPFTEKKHGLEWAKLKIEYNNNPHSKPTIFISVNNTGGELFDVDDIHHALKSIEGYKAKKEASSQKKNENTTI